MRIHQLTLATSDSAGQGAFWAETLGLPVRECSDGAVEVSLRASTIRFEQALPAIDPCYHFAINVPRGSILDAAAWIAERHELLVFHDDRGAGRDDRAYRPRRLRALLPGRRRQTWWS